MLNIISKICVSKSISGPKKVVENLIKGLEILGYPYCINKALDSTSQLWIHDDAEALGEASRLNLKAVVGPNIYILPRNIPDKMDLSNFVYIHPSKWAVDFWKDFGFNKCKLDSWPTGIDTSEFSEREKPKKGIVLIYFKQRYPEELEFLKKTLEKQNIEYDIISYGSYKQKDYLEKLKNTKYVIWLGRQESQGIALEEAMSMNVPVLVWDVQNIGHWTPNKKEGLIFTEKELLYENTTSAYYFNETCGIKIKKQEYLNTTIKKMEDIWPNLEPRKYVVENLNLKRQAKDLIELFNKYYNISYEGGKKEQQKTVKKWRNAKLRFRMFIRIKEIIKRCANSLKKQ